MILNLLIIVIMCSGLNYLFNKNNYYLKTEKDLHQNFTNKSYVLPVGGIYIFISIIIFNLYFLNIIYFYLFIMLLIGCLSDFKKLNSPILRLSFQILVILACVLNNEITLSSTRLSFLDSILEYQLFNVIFVCFCILIVINGTNFIDGLNGLVITYYSLVIFFLYLLSLENQLFQNSEFLISLLIVLLLLLVFNFMNKIYLGDSGSYLLGFLFGVYLIKLYMNNQYISPYYIILLLWYPCFENLFSIIRKYSYNLSPTLPDTRHLHQLIFNFLKLKIKNKNNNFVNNFSSIIINLYNFMIFLVGYNFVTKTDVLIFLILVNIFFYSYAYFYLLKKILNK